MMILLPPRLKLFKMAFRVLPYCDASCLLVTNALVLALDSNQTGFAA